MIKGPRNFESTKTRKEKVQQSKAGTLISANLRCLLFFKFDKYGVFVSPVACDRSGETLVFPAIPIPSQATGLTHFQFCMNYQQKLVKHSKTVIKGDAVLPANIADNAGFVGGWSVCR